MGDSTHPPLHLMDNFLSHPLLLPLVLGVAATIIGTIIIALAVRSWTKLRHLLQSITTHFMTLIKNFDRPTLVGKSRLNDLVIASIERNASVLLVEHHQQQHKELSVLLKVREAKLRTQEVLLQYYADDRHRLHESLASAETEIDHLRQQHNHLKEIFDILHEHGVMGNTGTLCKISGHYISVQNSSPVTIMLNAGHRFPLTCPMVRGGIYSLIVRVVLG